MLWSMFNKNNARFIHPVVNSRNSARQGAMFKLTIFSDWATLVDNRRSFNIRAVCGPTFM